MVLVLSLNKRYCMRVKKSNVQIVDESLLNLGLTDKDFKELVEKTFKQLPISNIDNNLKYKIKSFDKYKSKVELTYYDEYKKGSMVYDFTLQLFITIEYDNLGKTSKSILPHPVLLVKYDSANLELNSEDDANWGSGSFYSEKINNKRVYQINFQSVYMTSHYKMLGKVLIDSLFKEFLPIFKKIKDSKHLKFSEYGFKESVNEISKFLNGAVIKINAKETLNKDKNFQF